MVDNEDRLPKWVQGELLTLRNKIAELERSLSIARGEAASTGATGKVIADDLGKEGFPLHDRSTVTFKLPDGNITCMLRENGTLLDLNANTALIILPRASNSAYVKVSR